jgi:hypothetical protein
VAQWRWQGTFTGSAFQGIEPTGAWVQYRGCDVVEVAGDEIRRITAYVDGMEVARAIGMMPAMDSGAEKAMIQAFNVVTKARHALRERFGQ